MRRTSRGAPVQPEAVSKYEALYPRAAKYIAQAHDGLFQIVKSLGESEPQEQLVEAPTLKA